MSRTPRRTVVLTGATHGIGAAAARRLLTADEATHVVAAVRDPAAAPAPPRDVGPRYHPIACDLGSLDAVRAFAAEVRRGLAERELPPMRALLCCAGVVLPSAEDATADGHERTFGVNVLAHHLLARLLTPLLTPPARLVLVTSSTHVGDLRHGAGMPAPRWREPAELCRPGSAPRAGTAHAGREAYTTSKLALIHLTHEWARRAPRGVTVLSYNPGLVTGTGFARHYGRLADLAFKAVAGPSRLFPGSQPVRVAGARLAGLAGPGGPAGARSGAYVDQGAVGSSSPESYDEHRERELWETAERLTAPG